MRSWGRLRAFSLVRIRPVFPRVSCWERWRLAGVLGLGVVFSAFVQQAQHAGETPALPGLSDLWFPTWLIGAAYEGLELFVAKDFAAEGIYIDSLTTAPGNVA